jgi:hypothetical protein
LLGGDTFFGSALRGRVCFGACVGLRFGRAFFRLTLFGGMLGLDVACLAFPRGIERGGFHALAFLRLRVQGFFGGFALGCGTFQGAFGFMASCCAAWCASASACACASAIRFASLS